MVWFAGGQRVWGLYDMAMRYRLQCLGLRQAELAQPKPIAGLSARLGAAATRCQNLAVVPWCAAEYGGKPCPMSVSRADC